MEQARLQQILVNYEGFNARTECRSLAENPYKDPYCRALWRKGWTDADSGLERPESCPADCYWIVDDVICARGSEGFCVMFGNPVTAIGTTQGEYRLLREALGSIPEGETVYRVKLARRHGQQSIKKIR